MLDKIYVFIIASMFSMTTYSNSQAELLKCWNKQGQSLDGRYFTANYDEQFHDLSHDTEPWTVKPYAGGGVFSIGGSNFQKADKLSNGTKEYQSKVQLDDSMLLHIDYGSKDLSKISSNEFYSQKFESAKYSPTLLLNYFVNNIENIENDADANNLIYSTSINENKVSLYISKENSLIDKVRIVSPDDFYGDVETTYEYDSYGSSSEYFFPQSISIKKHGGKIQDEVTITSYSIDIDIDPIIPRPKDFYFEEESETGSGETQIKTEEFNDTIYFLHIPSTDSRSMVVEFRDFIFVAEAPLSSKYGELIIETVKQKSPGKQIRFFSFGHHHPHYIGGFRAFVHEGSNIISVKENVPYLEYLASAPHSIHPDALASEPRPLKITEMTGDSMEISDGEYRMYIHKIGSRSDHTSDYLIYYFPEEKLVFQGDLVWIPRSGTEEKAAGRQVGFYNALQEKALETDLIIQSWPISQYGVETNIPYRQLEESMGWK